MAVDYMIFLAATMSFASCFALLGSQISNVQKWLGLHTVPQAELSYKCDLPIALDPAEDGLISAGELFSSEEALLTQVQRHQAIVQVPTICFDDLGRFDEDKRWEPFYQLHNVLAEQYPVVHRRAKLEKVNTFGLVYTFQGSNANLKPILLAAHQDVVPVGNETLWTHPPFSGHWDGEWLWGRGSADDKDSLTAIMSAMEALLSNTPWSPTRTVILAFGFDEECSGNLGAGKISEFLEQRYGKYGIGVVLDESSPLMERIGDTLYALPGVCEKGKVDVWFELHVKGGHGSMPPSHTGIGIMAEIITALETNPYQPEIIEDGPTHRHLICEARYSSGAIPELKRLIDKNDLSGAAKLLAEESLLKRYLVQTSQAVDVIHAGVNVNALPEMVSLGVNYRVAPQDSIPLVQHNIVKHTGHVVAKHGLKLSAFGGDEEYERFAANLPIKGASEPLAGYNGTLEIKAKAITKPTPISPAEGPIWDVFAGTIRHTLAFNGTVVPSGETLPANTDTRHYLNLSSHIYRWIPFEKGSVVNYHAVDERARMDNHMDILKFYYNLVRNFDAANL